MTLCDFQSWVIKDAAASLLTGVFTLGAIRHQIRTTLMLPYCEKAQSTRESMGKCSGWKIHIKFIHINFYALNFTLESHGLVLCWYVPFPVDQGIFWDFIKNAVNNKETIFFKILIWLIIDRTKVLTKHNLEWNIGQGPLTTSRGKLEEESKQKVFLKADTLLCSLFNAK